MHHVVLDFFRVHIIPIEDLISNQKMIIGSGAMDPNVIDTQVNHLFWIQEPVLFTGLISVACIVDCPYIFQESSRNLTFNYLNGACEDFTAVSHRLIVIDRVLIRCFHAEFCGEDSRSITALNGLIGSCKSDIINLGVRRSELQDGVIGDSIRRGIVKADAPETVLVNDARLIDAR